MKQTGNSSHTKRNLLIILVVISAGVWVWFHYFANNKKVDIKSLTKITLKHGNIENTISAVGKIEPFEYVDLGAQVSGRIDKLYVDVGDSVKKKQLLAQIDPTIYQASLDSSKAALDSLQAELKQYQAEAKLANLQYNRAKKLFESKAVSREKLEDAEASYKVAQAKIEAVKAQIRQARSTIKTNTTNLGYTKIYATLDGIVTSQSVKEGETINANQTTPVIMQIAQLNKMTIKAEVSEADISSIEIGMPVYFTILGNDERRWEGKVRKIEPTPTVESDVVLYYVLFDVDNPDNYLRVQMSTQSFFVLSKTEDVLVVDKAYLDKQGRVCVIENGRIVHKAFEKGTENRFLVEVKSGLTTGQEILAECPDTKEQDK